MVYLLGVDHQVQHSGLPMTPERDKATRDFCTFLKSMVKDLNISMLVEEFNEDALRMNNVSISIVKNVAEGVELKHLYCDPTRQERKALGIDNDLDRREQFWLSRLEPHLNYERILLVCGASHLESFQRRLLDKGVKAEVLPAQFGVGLPPLGTTEMFGTFLDL